MKRIIISLFNKEVRIEGIKGISNFCNWFHILAFLIILLSIRSHLAELESKFEHCQPFEVEKAI
jgi:hypothetical protein